jgi:hypothetical protein
LTAGSICMWLAEHPLCSSACRQHKPSPTTGSRAAAAAAVSTAASSCSSRGSQSAAVSECTYVCVAEVQMHWVAA